MLKIISFISAFIYFNINAQTLSPSVLAVSGGQASNAKFCYSYTIGQILATSTKNANNQTLTQGFQQPYFFIEKQNTVSHKLSIEIKLHPNPFRSSFLASITNKDADLENINFEIFDFTGQKIMHLNKKIGLGLQFETFNFENFSAGQYFLRISNNNTFSETYKILKIN